MSDKTTPERLLLIETRLSDLYHLEERVKRLEETLAATKPAMTMEEVNVEVGKDGIRPSRFVKLESTSEPKDEVKGDQH